MSSVALEGSFIGQEQYVYWVISFISTYSPSSSKRQCGNCTFQGFEGVALWMFYCTHNLNNQKAQEGHFFHSSYFMSILRTEMLT